MTSRNCVKKIMIMRRCVLPSAQGPLFGLGSGEEGGLNHSDKHNLKLQDLRSEEGNYEDGCLLGCDVI